MVLDDYKEMAGILGSMKGKFLLTINDMLEIRKVLKGFKQLEVKLRYSVSQKSATEGKELIFTNY